MERNSTEQARHEVIIESLKEQFAFRFPDGHMEVLENKRLGLISFAVNLNGALDNTHWSQRWDYREWTSPGSLAGTMRIKDTVFIIRFDGDTGKLWFGTEEEFMVKWID